jgi:hypothetical protein
MIGDFPSELTIRRSGFDEFLLTGTAGAAWVIKMDEANFSGVGSLPAAVH